MAKPVEPYQLHPDVERKLVALLAGNREFYARIGWAIEPRAFSDPSAVQIAACVKRMSKKNGRPPGDREAVLLGLHSHFKVNGEIFYDGLRAAEAYLLDCKDIDPEPIITVFSEVVKTRQFQLQYNRLGQAFNQGELPDAKLIEQFARLREIGTVDCDIGDEVDENMFVAKSYMETGMEDLDRHLGGGVVASTLVTFGGDGKSGKSMAMSQVAAAGWARGELVLFLTTELLVPYQQLRVSAALANVEIDLLESRDAHTMSMFLEAKKMAVGKGGRVLFKNATKGNTSEVCWSVDDINRWIDIVEKQEKRHVARLVVDYADHLTAPKVKGDDGYNTGRVVYRGLKQIADDRKINVFTASQAVRRKQTKFMELGDFADSQHKVRLCDLAITINRHDDTLITLRVVADRHCGKTGTNVMPLPLAFSRGQLVVSGSAVDMVAAARDATDLFAGIGETGDGYDNLN
jgi:archaellum biogenesis ATPase FlaH